MSWCKAGGPRWPAKAAAFAFGAVLLAGCQAQPLYGSISAQNRSVAVSPANTRAEQLVRNELVLGFGGERTDADYRLTVNATSVVSGLLPGGIDNEFSAARTTITANYTLVAVSTGESLKSGTRVADAQLDLPSQNFAQERAKLEAEARAARAVATMIRADVASVLPR